MKPSKPSTLNVNTKSIVLLMPSQLTSRVNFMDSQGENSFGEWLKPLIEQLKPISQAQIAKAAGITSVQLSRIVTGTSGVKRETAANIIDALNKLAGSEIGNKTEGLRLAGFSDKDAKTLPEPLQISDFDGFDPEDISDIKKYIEYKKALRKQQQQQ